MGGARRGGITHILGRAGGKGGGPEERGCAGSVLGPPGQGLGASAASPSVGLWRDPYPASLLWPPELPAPEGPGVTCGRQGAGWPLQGPAPQELRSQKTCLGLWPGALSGRRQENTKQSAGAPWTARGPGCHLALTLLPCPTLSAHGRPCAQGCLVGGVGTHAWSVGVCAHVGLRVGLRRKCVRTRVHSCRVCV